MKRQNAIGWFLLFIFLISAAPFGEPVNAQDVGVRLSFGSAVKTPRARRTAKPAATQRVVVSVREVVKKETVPTSNLTVTTEPRAKVTLEAANKRQPTTNKTAPATGSVAFENLQPGEYTVAATLDGFKTKQTNIQINPRRTIGIDLDLEPVKYQLNIETNVSDGEVRYAPARLKEKKPDGSLVTEETAGFCIVPIKNGKAVIQELREGEGYYNIDVRPSPAASEFEPKLTAINVSEDAVPQDAAAKEPVEINLDLKLSTQKFAAAWGASEWQLPASWAVRDSKMKASGAGVALPANEQNRNYKDFEMIGNVRSLDGKDVGFALRARDKNYYLVQLSGKNAAEPYRFSFFIVKDGAPALLVGAPIEHLNTTIDDKKSFAVVVKGRNNFFEVSLKDSKTGKTFPLGNIEDRDSNFRKGAVGVAVKDNSSFEVGSFTICTPVCGN